MSINIQQVEELNKRSQMLNGERQRLIGQRDAAKAAYDKAVFAYQQKYGVTLTEQNLQEEYNAVQAQVKKDYEEQLALVESIERGDYKNKPKQEEVKPEPQVASQPQAVPSVPPMVPQQGFQNVTQVAPTQTAFGSVQAQPQAQPQAPVFSQPPAPTPAPSPVPAPASVQTPTFAPQQQTPAPAVDSADAEEISRRQVNPAGLANALQAAQGQQAPPDVAKQMGITIPVPAEATQAPAPQPQTPQVAPVFGTGIPSPNSAPTPVPQPSVPVPQPSVPFPAPSVAPSAPQPVQNQQSDEQKQDVSEQSFTPQGWGSPSGDKINDTFGSILNAGADGMPKFGG